MYHSLMKAQYIVEIQEDEDIACCKQCAKKLANNGFNIQTLRQIENQSQYMQFQMTNQMKKKKQQLSEFLCNLKDVKRKFITIANQTRMKINKDRNQITHKIISHQEYYNHLIDIIQKYRKDSYSLLKIKLDQLNKKESILNYLKLQLADQIKNIEQDANRNFYEIVKSFQYEMFSKVLNRYKHKINKYIGQMEQMRNYNHLLIDLKNGLDNKVISFQKIFSENFQLITKRHNNFTRREFDKSHNQLKNPIYFSFQNRMPEQQQVLLQKCNMQKVCSRQNFNKSKLQLNSKGKELNDSFF